MIDRGVGILYSFTWAHKDYRCNLGIDRTDICIAKASLAN